VEKYNY
jgi:hypothetical protein